MKKFLSLFLGTFLVLFSAGMAFVVGDYMGAKAQKDRDSLERADLHKALARAIEQFDTCEASDFLGTTRYSDHRDYGGIQYPLDEYQYLPEKPIP